VNARPNKISPSNSRAVNSAAISNASIDFASRTSSVLETFSELACSEDLASMMHSRAVSIAFVVGSRFLPHFFFFFFFFSSLSAFFAFRLR